MRAKEIRLDTLRGLRQMAAEGIEIDVAALDELIAEVEAATLPMPSYFQVPVESAFRLMPVSENTWELIRPLSDTELRVWLEGE